MEKDPRENPRLRTAQSRGWKEPRVLGANLSAKRAIQSKLGPSSLKGGKEWPLC